MTACTNHGGKARRVVTAALVGVLSVGTVPMVALAEGVSDAVSPMFAEGTEFAEGTTEFTFVGLDEDSGEYVDVDETENLDGVYTVDAGKLPVIPKLTKVTVAGGTTEKDEVDIDDGTIKDYKVRVYRADEDGEPTGTPLSGNKANEAGEYVVTVTALSGSPFAGQVFKQNFIVVGQEFPQQAWAYEDGDLDDTDFTYTGYELDVDFKYRTADGRDSLVEGVDYTVVYTDASGKEVEPLNAGSYTAHLTGINKYAGKTATYDFSVSPTNFKAADVTVAAWDSKSATPTHPTRVTITEADGTKTDINPSLVGIQAVGDVSGARTVSFNVTVDPSVAGNLNYVGGGQVKGEKVDELCTFQYNGSALQDTYQLDGSKSEGFAVDAVSAYAGKTKLSNSLIDPPEITATYAPGSDELENYTPNDDAANLDNGIPGEYKVTFDVAKTTVSDKVVAGTKTITVKVYKGVVDVDSSLYVYAPDSDSPRASITSYAKGYDGEMLEADDFDVIGKTTTGATLATSDIKRELFKGDSSVDSAVDAGDYKLVVTSEWYMLQNGTTELPVTIGKVDLSTLEVGAIKKWNDVAGEEYVQSSLNTVSDVDNAIRNLLLKYDTGVEGDDIELEPADNDTWTDFSGWDILPSNVDVDVEYNDEGTWKPVGDLSTLGQYRVTVTVAEDVASNFVLPEGATSVTREFTVADKSLLFSDVQPSDWYYDAVSKALNNQYMRGYAGTTTFGPEDKLTRAQAVIVLYNMSGISFRADTDSSYDETKGWVTGFDDVDGHAYYAQAVAWANKTGVVNGYDEDTFGPEDEITREQFAAMLSNYAKVVNRDETVGKVDASVLDEFEDAGTVSEWAKGAVAWAASATEDRDAVMGNNGSLMGQNKITRGEVAAMVTNYQPNPKVVIF